MPHPQPASPTSRWPRLNQALDTPGISARHRARLFVLGARTYSSHGELEKAGQLATTALRRPRRRADNWAIAWALHVLTIVTTMQGQMADALPLFDRALAVTEADPALTDLRLLLQINMAMSLASPGPVRGSVCAAARQGSVLRARSVPSSGWRRRRPRWASSPSTPGDGTIALAGDEAWPKWTTAAWPEHAAACSDLGIAAVICFHRGDLAAARRRLASADAACRADRATA